MAKKNLSEEELFKTAFENLRNEDVFSGKFGNDNSEKTLPKSPTPQEDIALVKESQDRRLMEDVIGDVERIDHSKYWIPNDEDADRSAFEKAMLEQNQTASSKKEIAPESKKNTKKKTEWEILADASIEAKVIDIRGFSETSALRELGISIRSNSVFRIVYGNASQNPYPALSREDLEYWIKGAKYRYAFSPESKPHEGLVAVKT